MNKLSSRENKVVFPCFHSVNSEYIAKLQLTRPVCILFYFFPELDSNNTEITSVVTIHLLLDQDWNQLLSLGAEQYHVSGTFPQCNWILKYIFNIYISHSKGSLDGMNVSQQFSLLFCCTSSPTIPIALCSAKRKKQHPSMPSFKLITLLHVKNTEDFPQVLQNYLNSDASEPWTPLPAIVGWNLSGIFLKLHNPK